MRTFFRGDHETPGLLTRVRCSWFWYWHITRRREQMFLWFIWKIPRHIALWCFIRVHAAGEAHWSYEQAYGHWENGGGR
jgi:hypothetical protein